MLRIVLVIAAAACTVAHAQSAGYPRILFITYNHAPLYDSASYMSAILGHMKLGDSVRALGVAGKYFRIEYGARAAYVLGTNAAFVRPASSVKGTPAAARGGRRTDSTHERTIVVGAAPAAGDSSRSRTPKAAAAGTAASNTAGAAGVEQQCNAITKAGTRCSRRTSDPSGYCWQHRKK